MFSIQKIIRARLLASLLVGAVTLVWNAAAEAQTTTSPLSSNGSFGGGIGGLSGLGNTGGGLIGSSFSGVSFAGSSFGGGFSASGSTSGTTFTGSSAMNTSNRGGFSGNWAGNFSGGSNRTSTLGSYGGGTAGTTMPSAFSNYYVNPLAPGWPNATQAPPFTSPTYSGNATGNIQGGSFGGTLQGNALPANLSPNNTAAGNTTTVRRFSYAVSPGFGFRPAPPNQVQSEVDQVLTRSTSLSPNRNIRVAVEGPAVVLRGTVPSDQDRRLAEALARLTPGVYEVHNELEVTGSMSQAGSGP